MLPLAGGARRGMPGWCTAGFQLEGGPDVEVMCGGINTKQPTHAGLWRQGNLLHFGFEESPAELNATGRDLLENAIRYIARFRGDRPLLRTPSAFVDPAWPRPRSLLESLAARDDATAARLAAYFDAPWNDELAGMTLDEARGWLAQNLRFARAGPEGTLVLDEDARDLQVEMATPGGVERAIDALQRPRDHDAAARLLARYLPDLPDGPGAGAEAGAWCLWWDEHRDALFFSELGGWIWALDPLAQRRGVPTRALRGPARADAAAARPR